MAGIALHYFINCDIYTIFNFGRYCSLLPYCIVAGIALHYSILMWQGCFTVQGIALHYSI